MTINYPKKYKKIITSKLFVRKCIILLVKDEFICFLMFSMTMQIKSYSVMVTV